MFQGSIVALITPFRQGKLDEEALLRLAADTGVAAPPKSPADWAALAMTLGVKGVHIAERDTQVSARTKPVGTFVNTWSVDG